MKTNLKLFLTGLLFLSSILVSCSDSDDDLDDKAGESEEAPVLTQKLNSHIYANVEDLYLWNNKVPDDIDIKYEHDSKAFFDKLLYKTDDKWSYLTDEAENLVRGYSGVETSFGYNLAFVLLGNNVDVVAVVLFVYPDSPAEKAGLKRGDLIMTCNAQQLNRNNYTDLIYFNSVELGLAYLDGNYIREKGTTVSLAAERMYLDPVNTWKVIRKNGHKIGYLCYTDFVTDSHDKLAQVFAEFKSEGVTDLVLDLRYNPGGAALTPPYLASFIAPSSVLAEKTLFLSEDWNHNYNLYWSLIGENRSQYFHQDIPTNLNLNRVYVLTTSGSASASEATISGLMPYMNVVKIGTTTHGKYCGAALLQFRDKDNKLVKDLENWAMSLIVYRFINKDGFTEFKNGIAPDYEVEDDIFDTYPLGDVKDPHLAKAIELITGNHSPVLSGIRTPKAPEGSTRLPFEQTRRYPLYGNMVDVIE